MVRVFLAVAFTIVFSACVQGANAEQFGIGKIKMGMPVEEVFKNEEVICKSKGMIYKYMVCNKLISIRSKPVQASFHFDSNLLAIIVLKLDPVNYQPIKDELKEKWGEPLRNQVDNDNIAMEWELPEGSITISYVVNKSSGSARMLSREGVQRYEEKLKEYRNH